MAASGGRSRSKRLSSSPEKCCASAAEPPLPQARILPLASRLFAMSSMARPIGAASGSADLILACALSSNWWRMRASRSALPVLSPWVRADAVFMPGILLYIHLELDSPARIGVRRALHDARIERFAAVHGPGDRAVLRARHVAELVAPPV